jgi:hypothetical protein
MIYSQIEILKSSSHDLIAEAPEFNKYYLRI